MVAACYSLNVSSTQQLVTVLSPGSADIGPVNVGASGSATFVISPQGSADNDYVTSIHFDQSCPQFSLDMPGFVPMTGAAEQSRWTPELMCK